MAVDEKVGELARQAWWDAWWKADYSWDGLAKKSWPGWAVTGGGGLLKRVGRSLPDGARRATLQDFWAAEKPHLIQDPLDPSSKWTFVHAPPLWKDGAPAKLSWAASDLNINGALDRALSRLPADAFDVDQPDTFKSKASTIARLGRFAAHWPLRLDGAVLDAIPHHAMGRPYINGRRVAFLSSIELPTDGTSIDLQSCLFEDGVYLDGAEGDAADLRLAGSVFTGACLLENTTMRNLLCARTTFCEPTDFDGCNCRTRADFGHSTFHSEVTFKGFKTRTAEFRNARFRGEADFSDSQIKSFSAEKAAFEGEAAFSGMTATKLEFVRATFTEDVTFDGAEIGRAVLRRCNFGGAASFRGASFDVLDGSSSCFEDSAIFTGGSASAGLFFTDVSFEGAAYFDNFVWPADTGGFLGAFREATFERYATFETDEHSRFTAFAAFDGAAFEGEARFTPASFSKDEGFRKALELARASESHGPLGHGLRTLRQAAENVRDRISEQRLHRYELLTRREDPQIGGDERALSAIYGAVSQYGYSLGLPVVWAIVLWVFGTVVYLLIGTVSGLDAAQGLSLPPGSLHPAIPEAAQLSARSIFSLFGVWAMRPPDAGAGVVHGLEAGLLWADPARGLVVRLVSSFQSVAAGALLFLTGLAVRRRFQIS